MFRVSKLFAPLALVAAIATVTTAFGAADGNQPPFGKFGQPGKGKGGKDDKKGDKKGEDKKTEEKKGQTRDKKGPAPTKSDPVVDAWVKVLIEKITDPHDTVRDSARGALVNVGPAALPALQKLADGDDPAKAVAARKLIHAIHGHHGHDHEGHDGHGMAPGGPPAKGGERGFGGRGFSGPGGGRGFGPGGPGGFGPGGWGGKGERGGPPGKGPGRGGREEEENEVQVAPMPHSVASR